MNKKTIKIFAGDKIIYLTNNSSIFSNNKGALHSYIDTGCTKKELKEIYWEVTSEQFYKDTTTPVLKENYLVTTDIERLFRRFKGGFRKIAAAGGLVKNKKGEYLFIFRNGKWDLPKGKLEKGESKRKCAMREVEEECGIKGLRILRKLPVTYHTYYLEERPVLKPTYWYEMECSDESALVPQAEEGITKVKWVHPNKTEMIRKNTYESILEVMQEIKRTPLGRPKKK